MSAREAQRQSMPDAYLAGVNSRLLVANEPQPAMAVGLTKSSVDEVPQIFIGYGLTETGEGLKHVTGKPYDIPPYNSRTGLALPLQPDTVKSATYFPLDHTEEFESEPTSEIGWWQQWKSDQFIGHVPGQSPDIIDIPGGAAIGDEPFTGWYAFCVRIHPSMHDDTTSAAQAANRAVDVMLDQPVEWRKFYEKADYPNQHFIVLGKAPVAAALEVIETKVNGGNQLPQPLTDMLGTIATDLNLPK